MIALASIAFNKPRLIAEQIRLLRKYLSDYVFLIFDTSTDADASAEIAYLSLAGGAAYFRLETHAHDEALNEAAEKMMGAEANWPYIGFLDHDIFPTCPTTLIDKIEGAGFYGVGQRHAPTGRLYLWPGFAFFSREWLAGRSLDFRGIRADNPADNGDTGSGMWPLFENEDWSSLYRPTHSYEPIREPDSHGLQSWGIEWIDSWLHFSNGSHWMSVPGPEERDRLLFDRLVAL